VSRQSGTVAVLDRVARALGTSHLARVRLLAGEAALLLVVHCLAFPGESASTAASHRRIGAAGVLASRDDDIIAQRADAGAAHRRDATDDSAGGEAMPARPGGGWFL
jgi:hypothetical protein